MTQQFFKLRNSYVCHQGAEHGESIITLGTGSSERERFVGFDSGVSIPRKTIRILI